MSFYEDLVMQTQINYSKYYHVYASGGTPYQLANKKPLSYQEQIQRARETVAQYEEVSRKSAEDKQKTMQAASELCKLLDSVVAPVQ